MEYENVKAWYVIQSYSGCENAAKINLERRVKSLNMENFIFQVLIPETKHFEKKKNGEMKEVVEKIFPGYIFVEMIVTDESWFVVRNTPMVTGFLGSSGGGAKPVPLADNEINPILKKCGIAVEVKTKFKVGDTVRVLDGAFVGNTGIVDKIDVENEIVRILVVFVGGRETPIELSFDNVEIVE